MNIKYTLFGLLATIATVSAEYTAKYNSSEVGATVQDTIGALFEALANNASLIVIVIIGMFAVGGIATIFTVLKGMGKR